MNLSVKQARSAAELLSKIEWEGGIGGFIGYQGAKLNADYDIPDEVRDAYAVAAAAVYQFESVLDALENHPKVKQAAMEMEE